MGKVLNDLSGAWSATLVIIGDKLGLYKAMSDSKPVTPAEVSGCTGTTEGYIGEWLANQAAGGYIFYTIEPLRGGKKSSIEFLKIST